MAEEKKGDAKVGKAKIDIQYPDYPCVALQGKTRQTYYEDGLKKEKVDKEIMFFPVSALDDLSHVDQAREFKRFAVIGFAHLEKINGAKNYKAGEIAAMERKLTSLMNPPEMEA